MIQTPPRLSPKRTMAGSFFVCINTENPGSLYDKLPGPPCVVGTLVVKEKQIMENSPADTGIIPHQLATERS